jgi:hypothetical protein
MNQVIYPNDQSTQEYFNPQFNRAKQPNLNPKSYKRSGTAKMYQPNPEATEGVNSDTSLSLASQRGDVLTSQFITLVDPGDVKIRLAGNIKDPGGAVYAGEPDQFDFKQLVPASKRKILAPRLFNLYYSVGFVGGGFDTGTAPASFDMDVYLDFAFFSPNVATDTGSYFNALKHFLNIQLPTKLRMINNGGLGSGFKFQQSLQTIDLLDTIEARGTISSFGNTYRNFNTNRDKIDKSDLDNLLKGEDSQISVGMAVDITTLTALQQSFIANDITVPLIFTLSYKFEYYAQLASI